MRESAVLFYYLVSNRPLYGPANTFRSTGSLVFYLVLRDDRNRLVVRVVFSHSVIRDLFSDLLYGIRGSLVVRDNIGGLYGLTSRVVRALISGSCNVSYELLVFFLPFSYCYYYFLTFVLTTIATVDVIDESSRRPNRKRVLEPVNEDQPSLLQDINSEAANQPIVETPTELPANQNEETFDSDETGAAVEEHIAGEKDTTSHDDNIPAAAPIADQHLDGEDFNADPLQVAGDANAQNHPEDNPQPPVEPPQNLRANGVTPRILWLPEETMPGDDRDTTVMMGTFFLLN